MRALAVASSLAVCLLPPVPLAAQGNPPSWANIRATLRVGADPGDQFIMVANYSDQPIIVTAVMLSECRNARGACSTYRVNVRIHPGQERRVHRVQARFSDQEFTFRYTFSWTTERSEPAAPEPRAAVAMPIEEVEKVQNPAVRTLIEDAVRTDSANRRVADTVVVTPGHLSLRVGERVELFEALRVVARSAEGVAIAGLRLRVAVEVGREFATLESGALVGVRPGTAVLLISPPLPEGVQGEPKGAARIIVRVLP